MQEGLANICLVTSSMTIVKAKIERRMPKKMQVGILVFILEIVDIFAVDFAAIVVAVFFSVLWMLLCFIMIWFYFFYDIFKSLLL